MSLHSSNSGVDIKNSSRTSLSTDLESQDSTLTDIVVHSQRSSYEEATLIGLAGFVLANTPNAVILLCLNGAGGPDGNAAAVVGPFIYLGCLLEILCGIGEWYRGDIFNAVVFLSLGGYFGAAAATMLPFYYAVTGYGTGPGATAAYHSSYAMFLISMAILLLLFTVASFTIDIIHILLFACFAVCFPFLAVSHLYAANANDDMAFVSRIFGGSLSMVRSAIAWVLLVVCTLKVVDFPVQLPVGELRCFKGRRTRQSPK